MADTTKIKVEADFQSLIQQAKQANKETIEMKNALKALIMTGQQGTPVFEKLSHAYQKQAMSAKQANTAVNQLTASHKTNIFSLLELGENLTVVTAGFMKLVSIVADVGKSFLKEEEANLRLSAALDGNVGAYSRLSNVASGLQGKFGIADEDIKSQQAFLIMQGRTESQINELIQTAIRLSAVTGEDLQSSVRKLDMTYEGQIGRLGKLDSALKDLTKEQLENGEAVRLIGEKYASLDIALEQSTSTKIKRLQTSWEELKESLGAGFFDAVNTSLDETNQTATDTSVTFKELAEVVGTVVGYSVRFNPFSIAIEQINKQIALTSKYFEEAKSEIRPFVNAFSEIAEVIPIISSVNDALTNLMNKFLSINAFTATLKIAGVGTLDEKERNKIAGVGTKGITTTGTGKSSQTKEEEIKLTLLGEQEKRLKELQTSYNFQTDSLQAQKDILLDILKVEEEIFRLKTGIKLTGFGEFKPLTTTEDLLEIPKRQFGIGNTGLFGNQREADIEEQARKDSEEFTKLFTDAFSQSLSFVDGILQKFQLSDTIVGDIVTSFQFMLQMIQGINSVTSVFDALLSFIPGGGAIGAIAGAGSMPNVPNIQSGSGGSPVNIVIQGDTTEYGAYKLVKRGDAINARLISLR